MVDNDKHFDYLNLFQHLGMCQDLGLFSEEHEQKILEHYKKIVGTPKQEKWKIRYARKIRNFLIKHGYLGIGEIPRYSMFIAVSSN